MNPSDANEDEMQLFTRLSERELDRILAGNATSGEHEDITTFFRELRSGFEQAPSPSVESRHLAAILEETRGLQPSAPGQWTSAPHATRKLRNPFRRLAARATITAVGLAALAAFGGAAYAGALPAPVQAKVAELARQVGLSLPTSHPHSTRPARRGNGGTQHAGHTSQPTQGSSSQSSGSGTGTNDGDQGKPSAGGGTQGNRTQTNGSQGSGTRGGTDDGEQGAQPTTVPNAQSGQGTQGDQNEPSTPSGGSGAGGNQQGNGEANDAGNANPNGTQGDGQGTPSNDDRTQGASTQTTGGQGSGTRGSTGGGERGAHTNGSQGAQRTTVPGAQSGQGTTADPSESSTPSGGSGAGGSQQGNEMDNSVANANQNG